MKVKKQQVVYTTALLTGDEWEKICDTDEYDDFRDKYNFDVIYSDSAVFSCYLPSFKDADDFEEELRELLEK